MAIGGLIDADAEHEALIPEKMGSEGEPGLGASRTGGDEDGVDGVPVHFQGGALVTEFLHGEYVAERSQAIGAS